MHTPKSIVLVTVDCLRADHVGFGGYDRPTTPFLDALAKDSFVFPAAIVAGAPTYYSFTAILGGRHPLGLGRDVLGLAPGETTLASELKRAGYATAAFSAANPYISPRFGYDQGFDTFRDFLNGESNAENSDHTVRPTSTDAHASRLNRALHSASRRLGAAARVYDELYFQYCQRWALPPPNSFDGLRRFPSAGAIVDQSVSWLASVGRKPFFLWLHLMDPHAPYYPTSKTLEQMGRGEISASRARYLNSFWQRNISIHRLARHRDDIVTLYDAGIRSVDTQMARLVGTLRDLGLWQNCIFALTGDHGEEFLDHGGRYHPPTRLLEELIRVPLLLRVPDVARKEVTRVPISLVNLPPTLIDAAQIGPSQIDHSLAFHGCSRWPQIQQGRSWEEPAVVECVAGCSNPFYRDRRFGPRVMALREARFKLVLEFDPSCDRLYDLEADPHELDPLPPSTEKPVRRRLLEYARHHIEFSYRGRDAGSVLRAHLAALRLEWAKPVHVSQTSGF